MSILADNVSDMPACKPAFSEREGLDLSGLDVQLSFGGSKREQFVRRSKASCISLLVMGLLFWLVMQPTARPTSRITSNPVLTVSLLPLPTLPSLKPSPVRFKQPATNVKAGGQQRRESLRPSHKPALTKRADAPAHVAATSLVPIALEHARVAVANESPLSAPDPDSGGKALSAGASGGRGMGQGRGDGDVDGSEITLVLNKANWVWKPSDDALRRFIPPEAIAEHKSGEAIIACRVQLSKRVHDCRVVAESAAGLGYGAAAVAASRIFRVYPPRRNGKPVDEAWVGIPIRWIVKPPPKPADGDDKQQEHGHILQRGPAS
jgi:protein TonB